MLTPGSSSDRNAPLGPDGRPVDPDESACLVRTIRYLLESDADDLSPQHPLVLFLTRRSRGRWPQPERRGSRRPTSAGFSSTPIPEERA